MGKDIRYGILSHLAVFRPFRVGVQKYAAWHVSELLDGATERVFARGLRRVILVDLLFQQFLFVAGREAALRLGLLGELIRAIHTEQVFLGLPRSNLAFTLRLRLVD